MNIEELVRRDGALRMLIRLSNGLLMTVGALVGLSVGAQAADLRVEATVSNNSVAATATDELGQPAAGAVVSFQLPVQGPSGVFANGLRTEIVVAGPDGRARVNGIGWDAGAGEVAIRVTAAKGGARAATLVERRVVPSAPVSLVPPPSNAPKSEDVPKSDAFKAAPKEAAQELDTVVPVYRGGSGWGKRMLWIAAIAGGAVAGGYAAQARRAGNVPTAATAASVAQAPALSIGAPIISVGRP